MPGIGPLEVEGREAFHDRRQLELCRWDWAPGGLDSRGPHLRRVLGAVPALVSRLQGESLCSHNWRTWFQRAQTMFTLLMVWLGGNGDPIAWRSRCSWGAWRWAAPAEAGQGGGLP